MCNLNYLDKPQKTRGQQVAHPTLAGTLDKTAISKIDIKVRRQLGIPSKL